MALPAIQSAAEFRERWYKLYHRLHAKRPPQIAAVAVARELVGFLWSVMQDLEHPVPQTM